MTKQSSHESPKRSRTFLWAAGLSAVASLGVHSYLLTQHFGLKFGMSDGKSICDVSDTFSCSAVSASRFSEFLGVPIALWGFSANLVMLLLLLWYPLTEEEKRPAARRNLLLVSGVIALTSVVMGSISAVAIGKLCLFCIFAYVFSFIAFGSLWQGLRSSAPLSAAKNPLNAPAFKVLDLMPLAIISVIAMIGSVIANDQIGKSYGGTDMTAFARDKVNEWISTPAVTIQTIDPLVKGPSRETARMTIVEFADFRCIHCKTAAPGIKAFSDSHSDVRVEFQPWPLDGECNTSIQQSNGASCLLARSVWCAEKNQKRGWDAHHYIYDQDIFASSQAVEEALPAIANAAGMTAETMKTCAQSDEAKDAIRKIAAVGTALNIQGTPTIFINNRKVSGGHSLPVLRAIYDRAGN